MANPTLRAQAQSPKGLYGYSVLTHAVRTLAKRRRFGLAYCSRTEADVVSKYLARYMQGSAISDGRILSDDGEYVTFQAKDYRHGGESMTLKVTGEEFVRRFLLHILPKRFGRIRYFGILSRRSKNVDLDLCRELLESEGDSSNDSKAAASDSKDTSWEGDSDELESESVAKCHHCGKRGTLRWHSKIPGTTGWQRNCSLIPTVTRKRLEATIQPLLPFRPP